MFNTQLKIAIVYDWIDKWGGVERLLIHLHTLFPNADYFTSAVEYKNAQWARQLTVHTSFLQKFPSFIRSKRSLIAPLYPAAFESLQFNEYDLVISVTSAFAKGIITKPTTKHICYLLTPPRYLWSHTNEYLPGIQGMLARPITNHLKEWDRIASHRPDGIISISTTTAKRASEYYGITTDVVYPPFDTDYWDLKIKQMKVPAHLSVNKPYFLWIGRMEKYKKPELIIETAKRKKDTNFILVGTGALENTLRKIAPKNCQFAGLIPDEELAYLYSHAKALIMPQNEDFGYVSLESQYCGCPVIAFRSGGACETVKEGQSGIFFEHQNTSSLVSVLERFEQISYNLRHSVQDMQRSLKDTFGIQRFDTQFVYQLKKYISL